MEVRIEGVSHRYGGLQALDGIALTVRSGETLALIGHARRAWRRRAAQ